MRVRLRPKQNLKIAVGDTSIHHFFLKLDGTGIVYISHCTPYGSKHAGTDWEELDRFTKAPCKQGWFGKIKPFKNEIVDKARSGYDIWYKVGTIGGRSRLFFRRPQNEQGNNR
jgi:hypothetical protein